MNKDFDLGLKVWLHLRFGDNVLRISNSWRDIMLFTKYDIKYRANGEWFEVVECNLWFSGKY